MVQSSNQVNEYFRYREKEAQFDKFGDMKLLEKSTPDIVCTNKITFTSNIDPNS